MKGVLFLGIAIAAHAADPDFFESKVRPVFAKNCYPCHTESRMGGLRLDSAEAVAKGGNSGPPILPGKPDESLLVQAIRRTHERIKMPPSGKLPDTDIAAIVDWVKAGATWPAGTAPTVKADTITAEQRAFWSFQPVRKPSPPKVKDPKWARTDIDRFVLARARATGPQAGAPGRPQSPTPPRHARSHRTAAHSRRSRRLPRRQIARRLRQGRRSPARIAPLWRTLGALVARRGALLR